MLLRQSSTGLVLRNRYREWRMRLWKLTVLSSTNRRYYLKNIITWASNHLLITATHSCLTLQFKERQRVAAFAEKPCSGSKRRIAKANSGRSGGFKSWCFENLNESLCDDFYNPHFLCSWFDATPNVFCRHANSRWRSLRLEKKEMLWYEHLLAFLLEVLSVGGAVVHTAVGWTRRCF